MYEQKTPLGSASASARLVTTLLIACWGLASAYILFYSLLVTHDMRPCLAALVPLVIVWATLERKRWGRLAMLGLSATALGLFLAAMGYAFAFGNQWLAPAQRTPANYVQVALRLYAQDNPTAALVIVALAAMTGVWMRRPAVAAEFESGKRAALAVAQRAIALSLVSFWGITMVAAPVPPKGKNTLHHKPAHGTTIRAHSHAANSRRSRSAASEASL